jgi:hypothetical protein
MDAMVEPWHDEGWVWGSNLISSSQQQRRTVLRAPTLDFVMP